MSTAPSAQTPRVLIETGDEVFPIKTITSVDSVYVSDAGEWIALVDTNRHLSIDYALVRNGFPMLVEGDRLPAPPNASIDGFRQFSINSSCGLGMSLFLRDVPASGDEGAYYDTRLLAQKGELTSAPEFGTGTRWHGFFHVLINDENDFVAVSLVEDPTIPSNPDFALVLFTTDDEGNVVSENVLVKQGDPLPDQSSNVKALGTRPLATDFNNRGDFILFVSSTGTSSSNENIYLSIGGEWTNVAREGHESPVAGREWTRLSVFRLDINDRGDYVIAGKLSGYDGNHLIVRNGEKFRQGGDYLTALPNYAVRSFINLPVFISEMGKVCWSCEFTAPDADRDLAIFVDEALLVREGETFIENQYITALYDSRTAFSCSPNGRYVAFRAMMPDNVQGAYLIDLGLVEPMSECLGNEGTLVHASGWALLGHRLELEMAGGQALGVLPILFLSGSSVAGWPPCGIGGSAGELLIDLSPAGGNLLSFDVGPPWGGAPISFFLDIPDEAVLVGVETFAQGLFWDVGDQFPEANLRLTSGLRIVTAAS